MNYSNNNYINECNVMKKKIICFILVMCTIINFGSVFADEVIFKDWCSSSLARMVIRSVFGHN